MVEGRESFEWGPSLRIGAQERSAALRTVSCWLAVAASTAGNERSPDAAKLPDVRTRTEAGNGTAKQAKTTTEKISTKP